jgi:Zn-dependent M28 family amino/carboxypeptidase
MTFLSKETLFITLALSLTSFHSSAREGNTHLQAYQYLQQIVSKDSAFGAREAGSKKEKDTATFIAKEFERFGYKVELQAFDFVINNRKLSSTNVIAELGNTNLPTLIVGAHYDSTGKEEGSLGVIDNGSGIAALLEIAGNITSSSPNKFNIRFIAFGAEEVGVLGAKHYVKKLSPSDKENIIGMINFDTISGGDIMYIHSAHSTPYQCDEPVGNYNFDTLLRQALIRVSTEELGKDNQYSIHPDYQGYPEGETGGWSDHAPFSCAGIPIAYVEATNFSLKGKNGYDGYSQTKEPKLWNCFEPLIQGACDAKTEKLWGSIWHTQFDDLVTLEAVFPGRIKKQLDDTVKIVSTFLSRPEKYLNNSEPSE